MHGGDLLKLIDQAAYACSSRFTGMYMVTLAVDQVMFKHSIKVGSLVHLLCKINYTGKTSLEVGIKVVAEDILAQSVMSTNSCYVTMVALDKKTSKPMEVPQFTVKSEEDRRRWDMAIERRKFRFR
jgi:acyl-CoA hydrolase